MALTDWGNMKNILFWFYPFFHLYIYQFNTHICLADIWSLFLISLFPSSQKSFSLDIPVHSGKLHGNIGTAMLSTHFSIGIRSISMPPLFQTYLLEKKKKKSPLIDENMQLFFYFVSFNQDRILTRREHWNTKKGKTVT